MSPPTTFAVHVTPRAGRTAVVGWQPSADTSRQSLPSLLVKLAAAPVQGAANDALIALLAHVLDLPKRAIRIVSGTRSRTKRVEVHGLTFDEVRQRLRIAPAQ